MGRNYPVPAMSSAYCGRATNITGAAGPASARLAPAYAVWFIRAKTHKFFHPLRRFFFDCQIVSPRTTDLPLDWLRKPLQVLVGPAATIVGKTGPRVSRAFQAHSWIGIERDQGFVG